MQQFIFSQKAVVLKLILHNLNSDMQYQCPKHSVFEEFQKFRKFSLKLFIKVLDKFIKASYNTITRSRENKNLKTKP